ncbi:hypothetical protein EFD56_24275 [Rhizobium phaseoli]|nr:hypothetical protein EFD56_24275 [Rhizobium phaseoli]
MQTLGKIGFLLNIGFVGTEGFSFKFYERFRFENKPIVHYEISRRQVRKFGPLKVRTSRCRESNDRCWLQADLRGDRLRRQEGPSGAE